LQDEVLSPLCLPWGIKSHPKGMIGNIFGGRQSDRMPIECDTQILGRKSFHIGEFDFDGVEGLTSGSQELEMRCYFEVSLGPGNKMNCQVLFLDGKAGTEKHCARNHEYERKEQNEI
jgi:hypothetical protein